MEFVLRHSKRISVSVWRIIIKWWYIVVILIAIGGYLFYRQQTAKSQVQLETYTVSRETLKDSLILSGKIDATEKVDLHFQSAGRLAWVGVKEGDLVKKYQGIASLDQRQLQKTLEKYLNTYSKERRDFEQSTEDNDESAIALSQDLRETAKRTLENAQFDLNNTVLDVELQAIAKEYSYLYTPIEGIVTRIDAPTAGLNVSITDIYEVINPQTVYFAVSADQTEVVNLHAGQKGTITLDAYPDNPIIGTVDTIAFTPKTDETGTVYEVKVPLTEATPSAMLRIGMTGDAEFVLKELPNVVAVPFQYVIEEDAGSFVNKKENGKINKVPVKLGGEYEDMIEIKDGIQPGDVLVEISK